MTTPTDQRKTRFMERLRRGLQLAGVVLLVAGLAVIFSARRPDTRDTAAVDAAGQARLAHVTPPANVNPGHYPGRNVTTASGPHPYTTRTIESLAVGDFVLARDEHDPDAPLIPMRVQALHRRVSDHLRVLTLEDQAGRLQVIRTTDEHPFYLAARHAVGAAGSGMAVARHGPHAHTPSHASLMPAAPQGTPDARSTSIGADTPSTTVGGAMRSTTSVATDARSTSVAPGATSTDRRPHPSPTRAAARNDNWTRAADLAVGDQLTGPHGQPLWVRATTYQPHPRGIEVYNLTIDAGHTYYVTEHPTRGPPVWVHNKPASGRPYLTSSDRVDRYRARVQELVTRHRAGTLGPTRGKVGERLAELQGRVEMMDRGFLKLGHGRYNRFGHGIDAIYQHVSSGEIAVLESKWRADWLGWYDPNSLMGRGHGHVQMSDPWLRAVRDQMLRSQSPDARSMGMVLRRNGWQRKYVNVLDQFGDSYLYRW